jgi:membrane protease YdiL (CAAX protease family)
VRRVWRAIGSEVVAIGLVAAYNIGVTRIRRRARLPANVGAAAALVGLARVSGVSASELGLARANVGRGFRVGLLASAPLAVTVAGAVAAPSTRRLLADEKVTGTGPAEAVFETLVRIPLETALAEEVIFRGVLLALGQRSRSRGWAVATSSALFGLWHVVPTLEALSRRDDGDSARVPASTTGIVAATAVAGAGFAWLRLCAGSVVAPILAHATVNMVAFAGVRLTADAGSPGGGEVTRNEAGAQSGRGRDLSDEFRQR